MCKQRVKEKFADQINLTCWNYKPNSDALEHPIIHILPPNQLQAPQACISPALTLHVPGSHYTLNHRVSELNEIIPITQRVELRRRKHYHKEEWEGKCQNVTHCEAPYLKNKAPMWQASMWQGVSKVLKTGDHSPWPCSQPKEPRAHCT